MLRRMQEYEQCFDSWPSFREAERGRKNGIDHGQGGAGGGGGGGGGDLGRDPEKVNSW